MPHDSVHVEVSWRRGLVVAAAYLIPAVVSLWFWASSDSTHWASAGGANMAERLMIGWLQLGGPIAWLWLLVWRTPIWVPLLLTAVTWYGWLSLMCLTICQRLPWPAHFYLASMWCLSGFYVAGLCVT